MEQFILLGHDISCPYQLLSFSYPSFINKSPATSLKIFLCSDVKCFFHSPVLPERKVGDLLGLMDDSSESSIVWRGVLNGTRTRKWSMMRFKLAVRSLTKSSKWIFITSG